MRQRTASLRRHLSIFGILIVCPLLVAGLLIAALYVIEEQRTLHNEAIATVLEATIAIDHELTRNVLALQMLSTSMDSDQESIGRVYRQAKQLTDTIPGSLFALRSTAGETVFNTSFPFGTALEKRMNETLNAAETNTVANRKYAISNVFVSRTGKTFVGIVHPVVRDNQVIYFLDLGIPTDVFSNILRSQLRQQEWLIGVTGTDGRILARNWDADRYVGQKASDAFLQNTEGDEGSFRATTLDGVRVFNVYARSKLTGWRVGAGIPMNIFEAPLYRSFFALAGITAIALCCSIGLSYARAGVMLKPAEELRKLAGAPAHHRELPEHTGVSEFDSVLALLAKCFADLDDRERHQQTLVNELNHRAKNTLAAMQAIVYQTHRQSKSWAEFRTNFEQRLSAMARSFDLLTKNDWRSSQLNEVIVECCKPFCEQHRMQLNGPAVLLTPNAVVGMGMVIHELAMNATKYGAFSNAVGWVEVSWEIQDGGTAKTIHFVWKEHEGPPVTQIGEQGFGSLLISSTVQTELRGKAETKFEPDGLCFSASFPVDDLFRNEQRSHETDRANPPTSS